MTPDEQNELVQKLAEDYSVDATRLGNSLTAIHTYYDELKKTEYKTTQDRKRELKKAADAATKLQKILRELDASNFNAGTDNTLHDLDAAVSYFLPMVEPAIERLPRKSDTEKPDNVLVNRLAHLYKSMDSKFTVYYSKSACGYEGTLVTFLEKALPFFGINKIKADAYAQRYINNS